MKGFRSCPALFLEADLNIAILICYAGMREVGFTIARLLHPSVPWGISSGVDVLTFMGNLVMGSQQDFAILRPLRNMKQKRSWSTLRLWSTQFWTIKPQSNPEAEPYIPLHSLLCSGNVVVECRTRDGRRHACSQLIVVATSLGLLSFFTIRAMGESYGSVLVCQEHGRHLAVVAGMVHSTEDHRRSWDMWNE